MLKPIKNHILVTGSRMHHTGTPAAAGLPCDTPIPYCFAHFGVQSKIWTHWLIADQELH